MNFIILKKNITMDKAHGNVKLNLITKETIRKTLEKIKKEKIRQNIYLAEIQIIIKALFPEQLDTPLILSLHDKRLINANESHLEIIQGNLYHTKIMFTCYPKYCICLNDQDFNDYLRLHFKFLRNDFMKEVIEIDYKGIKIFCKRIK